VGQWVSAAFGYGIVLPDFEDGEYEPSEWAKQFLDPDSGDIDWYDLGQGLEKEFNVHVETGHVGWDYGCRQVAYATEPLVSYETVKKFDHSDNSGYNPGLKQAAEALDIPFEPGYVLVASYG
jgi:hypothetical protein